MTISFAACSGTLWPAQVQKDQTVSGLIDKDFGEEFLLLVFDELLKTVFLHFGGRSNDQWYRRYLTALDPRQTVPLLCFPPRLKASALAALLHPGLDSARMETKCMTPNVNMDICKAGGTESSRKSFRVDGNLGIE